MWIVNFQMFKLVLEKAEEPEIKLPTSTGSLKKQESSRKTSAAAAAKSLQSWPTLCNPGQPTRLPGPWDSPGKNTGVSCHFLLQCMKVKSESEVTQSCLTLSDPVDCSPPGSSVHGIFQARVLEWVAIAFSKKNIYFCFIDCAKAFDCVYHNKLCKILKEMGIPDRLTCLLRNLCAGQEATVRTGHGTTDWFQIRKGVCQGCILSPCLFNLYAEYIMRNAGLDETQAGIKIAGRNINNLRHADNTTLMAEIEELKSL